MGDSSVSRGLAEGFLGIQTTDDYLERHGPQTYLGSCLLPCGKEWNWCISVARCSFKSICGSVGPTEAHFPSPSIPTPALHTLGWESGGWNKGSERSLWCIQPKHSKLRVYQNTLNLKWQGKQLWNLVSCYHTVSPSRQAGKLCVYWLAGWPVDPVARLCQVQSIKLWPLQLQEDGT